MLRKRVRLYAFLIPNYHTNPSCGDIAKYNCPKLIYKMRYGIKMSINYNPVNNYQNRPTQKY